MGTHTNEVGVEIRVRNHFLKEMDGIMDKVKAIHVYDIGATNKPGTGLGVYPAPKHLGAVGDHYT